MTDIKKSLVLISAIFLSTLLFGNSPLKDGYYRITGDDNQYLSPGNQVYEIRTSVDGEINILSVNFIKNEMFFYRFDFDNKVFSDKSSVSDTFKPYKTDMGYILQHKMTGLFVNRTEDGSLSLSAWKDRTLWNFESIQPKDNRIYTIQNRNSGTFFDISTSWYQMNYGNGVIRSINRNGSGLDGNRGAPDQFCAITKDTTSNKYIIQPLHSLLIWDKNGNILNLNDKDNRNSSKFDIYPVQISGQIYYLIKQGNMYLTRNYNFTSNIGDTAYWRLEEHERYLYPDNISEYYYIKSAYSKYYWDMAKSGQKVVDSVNDGTNIIQLYEKWDDNDRDRRFRFIPTGDYPYINIQVELVNGKHYYLSVKNDGSNKLEIVQKASELSKFILEKTSLDIFLIRTKNGNKAVDIVYGIFENETEIKVWDAHYGINQKFTIDTNW